MKQVVIYVFICVTVGFMVLIINKNEETISPKCLTVDTYYSYLDKENELLYIDFYLSTTIHPLADKNAYQRISLHDESYTKSLI